MITKAEALAGGVGNQSGVGRVLNKLDMGVRNGSFTQLFYPSELTSDMVEPLRDLLQAKGWQARIERITVNEGDYTGYCAVDKVRVTLR